MLGFVRWGFAIDTLGDIRNFSSRVVDVAVAVAVVVVLVWFGLVRLG